ncbi:MAG: YicC/YloC family endoribonuclease [Candidatus Omnitrophota bacterium]|jgi:uncharacterized protein (TIGR00255 family)
MISSMTGFANNESLLEPCGKISVELRSINHKFREVALHLPEGFLSFEERIKKEIESKVKRGRITCVITIVGGAANKIYVNRELVKNYVGELHWIKNEFGIRDDICLGDLINLPGVLSLEENALSKNKIWPSLKHVLSKSVQDLIKARQREGKATSGFLKARARRLERDLKNVKSRFSESVRIKLAHLRSDEERSSFLKDADISEEIERLSFHIKNLTRKLSASGAVGKEVDFIAQEMQRETNTMGAKSSNTRISALVVQMKSQIEKIREQAQNIE